MGPAAAFCWRFDPLGWPCLSQSEWASWVQAIGSILAILIAIAVPAVQHAFAESRRKREHSDRARSLGLRLLPSIQACAEANNAIWDNEHPDEDVENVGDNACVIGPIARDALLIPPDLLAASHQLHDLGEAAAGVQRAIFNITRAKDLLTTMSLPTQSPLFGNRPRPVGITSDKKKFYDLLWDALLGLVETQNRIEGMFSHSSRPVSKKA